MFRKEFERCAPEAVGVPSAAVARLLDSLAGFTEMHSLMLMRQGKVFAEGWWQPCAPGLRHTMMSCSKTFTATAIGIALREGLLSLDETIAEIFPEHLPERPGKWVKDIRVRDVLCMGSGMEEETFLTQNWIDDFLAAPIRHRPGTYFLYNNAGTTLLAAIIRRKTGLGLLDYLKPRLFDIIGIDAERLTCIQAPDGTDFGAGGIHCATEDLLRLMKLYADGGAWEGRRVLAEDYIRDAVTARIDTSHLRFTEPGVASDHVFGYGYQMWPSRFAGVFRAEGANGQYGLVDTARGLIIACTAASPDFPVSQGTLDRFWAFLAEIDPAVHRLPPDAPAASTLAGRLAGLSIAAPPYAPFGEFPHPGAAYRLPSGGALPLHLFYDPLIRSPEAANITGITAFSFTPVPGRHAVRLDAVINGKRESLIVATDGSRALNTLPFVFVSQVYLSGYWWDENTFAVRFRWVESVFEKELAFRFEGQRCFIHEKGIAGQFPAFGEPLEAALAGREMIDLH